MKIEFLFKWYDLWIGIFYDKKKNWIYFLPLPTIGIILKLPENWRISYIIRLLKLPNYGICKRCKRERAMNDYNGYYVCDHCYKMLNDEFEDEYK